jgi:hypothetical protein
LIGSHSPPSGHLLRSFIIFHDLLGIVVEVYIDDIVVKSAGLESHLADLHLAFERMCRFGLKMNPLKCAFGYQLVNS